MADIILDEFKESEELIRSIYHCLREFLRDFSRAETGWSIEFTSGRLKDYESLAEKLKVRYPGKYDNLVAVSDIIGLRLVTLYGDKVSDLADSLKKWLAGKSIQNHMPYKSKCLLERLTINRIDISQKKSDVPSQFSYRSSHLDISLTANNKKFSAEVQVRSLSMHLHAQMSHDVIYKGAPSFRMRRMECMLNSALELVETNIQVLRDSPTDEPQVEPIMIDCVKEMMSSIEVEYDKYMDSREGDHLHRVYVEDDSVEFPKRNEICEWLNALDIDSKYCIQAVKAVTRFNWPLRQMVIPLISTIFQTGNEEKCQYTGPKLFHYPLAFALFGELTKIDEELVVLVPFQKLPNHNSIKSQIKKATSNVFSVSPDATTMRIRVGLKTDFVPPPEELPKTPKRLRAE